MTLRGFGVFSFLVALATGVVPPARVTTDELAAARRLLTTASQSPELADLSQKTLQIGTELERTVVEFDKLKTEKVAKNDPRALKVNRTLEDLRARLTALKAQAEKSQAVKGKAAQAEIEANQAATKKAGAQGDDQASRDRRKAGLDAIQKLLDIIHSMKPNI